MKDWLIMLFLRGENDLMQFGEDLLAEASRVGSTDRVAVVAELDPSKANAATLRGPLLAGGSRMTEIGVTDGSPATIVSFVEDCKETYDARNRALILWDHGNGWQNVHVFEQVVRATNVVNKRDELAARHDGGHGTPAPPPSDPSLFINNLRTVLDEKRGIHIAGFDACLMSMIEVAFQLRNTAQFMVASEHVVPAARGWAYEALLRTITLDPRMSPEAVVRAMVDTFAGSYNGSNEAVTLTGLRLSAEVDRAVFAIDGFAAELLQAIKDCDEKECDCDVRSEIVYARRHTQSFGNPDYIDIVSFCDQVIKRLRSIGRLARTAELVKAAIERLVVRHTRSGAASLSESRGVSIYFPHPVPKPVRQEFFGRDRMPIKTDDRDTRIADEYRQLDFANPHYCRWLEFLEVIIKGEKVKDRHAVINPVAGHGDDTHGQTAAAVVDIGTKREQPKRRRASGRR
jgi:Clostripain family